MHQPIIIPATPSPPSPSSHAQDRHDYTLCHRTVSSVSRRVKGHQGQGEVMMGRGGPLYVRATQEEVRPFVE